MVKIDYTYQLGAREGSSTQASNQYIILHETGNANNTGSNSALNEAKYMKSHWNSAYTHAIAGHDRVYIIGNPGYVAYGAGSPANGQSPFQIELSRYADKSLALKAYRNWIEISREMAKKYGIPLTLDQSGSGIKSHKWVSDHLWGNHQDPYAYLATLGISKEKLQQDLLGGISVNGSEGVDEMSWTVDVKYDALGAALVTKNATIYNDFTLTTSKNRTLKKGSVWVATEVVNGVVNLGGAQWVDGRDVVVKFNPVRDNPNVRGIVIVTADDLWTQAKPQAGQAGIKHLAKGSTWKSFGRTGKYIKLGTNQWVDAKKIKIRL